MNPNGLTVKQVSKVPYSFDLLAALDSKLHEMVLQIYVSRTWT